MTTYTPTNPQWSDSIRVTDTSTPNNGDLIAEAPEKLLDNDYVLAEADFNNLYGLCTKTTTIGVDGNNHKQITETGDGVTAVTTIVQTSATVKTITTVVTPQDGEYYYTKITTTTKTQSGKTIAESYTRATQE